MNVGRGLFRAWVVLSVLWIGSVIFLSAGSQYAPILPFKPDPSTGPFSPYVAPQEINADLYRYIRSPSAEKLAMEFRSRQDQISADPADLPVGFPDGTKLYIPYGFNETDRNYIAQQFWQQRWSRWMTTAKDLAVRAVLPCVVLFVLGYALLWVGRGFRRA